MHEKIGVGKTLILLMPEEFGINDVLAENLRFHGFDVIYIKKPAFKYNNLWERLCNSIRKNILKDDTYKIKQQEKLQMQQIMSEIQQRKQKIDYALFIRADIFSIDSIQLIKENSQYLVNYQWDGIARAQNIFQRFDLFDEIFAFDLQDIEQYPQFKFASNFYFDMYPYIDDTIRAKKVVYYVGSHIDSRAVNLIHILKYLKKFDLEQHIYISNIDKNVKKQKIYQGYDIHFIKQAISFEQNIHHVQQSDILIDLVSPVHNGLSFRCFEALYYKKKLITNNEEIKKYDFYHPDNIFVWGGKYLDEESLKIFLNKPYQPIAQEIIEYYSFQQWLKRVLLCEFKK